MCKDCGCSHVESYAVDGMRIEAASTGHSHAESGSLSLLDGNGRGHTHSHSHAHSHTHEHDHEYAHESAHRILDLHAGLFQKNDRLAERNRGYFQAKGVLVINLFSSPGSGKTALLERTAIELAGRVPMGVVVGDLETENDARRIREAGIPAVQITTGTVCHLEADMVSRAVARLPLDPLRILFIENVGNLVCPAAYDLGEDLRVVLLSVTEGEDKPLKYPTAFRSADVVLLSKIDIAEAVGFDRETTLQNIHGVAPQAPIFEISARTGEGMASWIAFLEHQAERKNPQ